MRGVSFHKHIHFDRKNQDFVYHVELFSDIYNKEIFHKIEGRIAQKQNLIPKFELIGSVLIRDKQIHYKISDSKLYVPHSSFTHEPSQRDDSLAELVKKLDKGILFVNKQRFTASFQPGNVYQIFALSEDTKQHLETDTDLKTKLNTLASIYGIDL